MDCVTCELPSLFPPLTCEKNDESLGLQALAMAGRMAEHEGSSDGTKKPKRAYHAGDYQRIVEQAFKGCNNVLEKRKRTIDKHVKYLDATRRSAFRDEYQRLFKVSIDTVPVEPVPKTPIPDRKKKGNVDKDDVDAEEDNVTALEDELWEAQCALEGLELKARTEDAQMHGQTLSGTVDDIIAILISGGCVYQNDIPGIRTHLLDKTSMLDQHAAFKKARQEYLRKFHTDKDKEVASDYIKRFNSTFEVMNLLRKHDPDARAAEIEAAKQLVRFKEASLAEARGRQKRGRTRKNKK